MKALVVAFSAPHVQLNTEPCDLMYNSTIKFVSLFDEFDDVLQLAFELMAELLQAFSISEPALSKKFSVSVRDGSICFFELTP